MKTKNHVDESRSAAGDGPARVLFVASSGGHLAQLLAMRSWWEGRERSWATFDTSDVTSKLAGETIDLVRHPTTRNIPNLLRNTAIAWRVLRERRPDVVVSTGAGAAIPFFLFARLLGIHTVFVEVYDRISRPTVTGRVVRPLSSLFCVQWEDQTKIYPGALVIGPLL